MDKKSIAVAAGLMCLSWGALYPVYLLIKKNRELKKELEVRKLGKFEDSERSEEIHGSENEKSLSGKISVENGSTHKGSS